MQRPEITVVVGSTNPLKIKAVKEGFSVVFKDHKIKASGQKAPSGVSPQPIPHSEVYQGALNRANYCKKHFKGDFFVGVEGGLSHFMTLTDLFLTGFVVILSEADTIGVAGGQLTQIPEELAKLIKSEKRISGAADIYFKTIDSKHKYGLQGLLTNQKVDRGLEININTIKALILHKIDRNPTPTP